MNTESKKVNCLKFEQIFLHNSLVTLLNSKQEALMIDVMPEFTKKMKTLMRGEQAKNEAITLQGEQFCAKQGYFRRQEILKANFI